MAKTLSLPDAARLFKMLGDEARLCILLLLAGRGAMNVGELCAAVGMRQAALSHHLSHLLLHGLIACRRRGRYRYYAIAPGIVRELLRFVKPERRRL
jgi:DNA-binding transcriptional ArsR family regulator